MFKSFFIELMQKHYIFFYRNVLLTAVNLSTGLSTLEYSLPTNKHFKSGFSHFKVCFTGFHPDNFLPQSLQLHNTLTTLFFGEGVRLRNDVNF